MRRSLTRGVTIDRTQQEIEKFHNQLTKFATTPSGGQLVDYELCAVNDGTNVYLGLRVGNSIYRVQLTEV